MFHYCYWDKEFFLLYLKMNREELESELGRIIATLPDEHLNEIIIYSKHFQNNLLKKKSGAFDYFYNSISRIAERPHMYGVQNVEGLSMVIMGMSFGAGDLGDIARDFQGKFREYVNKKHTEDFKSRSPDFDWPRLVRLYSSGDSHSLELFSRWFAIFRDSYKKELSKDKKQKE